MQKPEGYDEVKVGGDFTPVELGGHKMVIKGVREEKSKKGRDMLVVAFDFDRYDKQPAYFSNLFEQDIRPDKKWPNNGTQYILTLDMTTGKAGKSFKGFITACEKSNDFEVNWSEGAKFTEQFKGKKIGGVFGEVEEFYNGKVTKKHKLRWFCEYKKAEEASIPQPKLLDEPVPAASTNNAFVNVPEGTDEEIPF